MSKFGRSGDRKNKNIKGLVSEHWVKQKIERRKRWLAARGWL